MTSLQDPDEIVEVVGSSTCFEYQFPASPAYFIGREPIIEAVNNFIQEVLDKKTSCRGFLFQGNSGWGKSSAVLECVSRLQDKRHFAVAIDSRSISSPQFMLHVVDYTLRKFGDFKNLLPQLNEHGTIRGFEDAIRSLIEVGQLLEQSGSILVVFLDQFENVFFKTDALRKIKTMFLKVCDAQTNIVLGFSWKSDLIGSMTDLLPYQFQTDIMGSSLRLDLEPFSDAEMAAFLDNFTQELKISLNNDLKFFLTDFAQGYPWLLRKLCAHVKAQLDSGIPQMEIANGLSSREEDILKRIAKMAPIGVRELDEDFSYDIVQSLIDKRLLKRIGSKYDISWDILRDYLNSSILPIRKNYILLAKSGSLIRAVHLLFEANGEIDIAEFQEQLDLADISFSFVMRDMQVEDALTMEKMCNLLAEWSPYMSLSKSTWREYARTFAKLMEAAHLATFISRQQILIKYEVNAKAKENSIPQARHRVGITVPWTYYSNVEEVMVKLYTAIQRGEQVELTHVGLKANTFSKVLSTLEDLGFITRKHQTIVMLPKWK